MRGVPTIEMLNSHHPYLLTRARRDLTEFLNSFPAGFSTIQITSRASVLESIKFKPLVRGEDTQISKEMQELPYAFLPSTKVTTEDRAREGAFSGELRLKELKEGGPKLGPAHPYSALTKAFSNDLVEMMKSDEIEFASAVKRFQDYFKKVFNFELAVEDKQLFKRLSNGDLAVSRPGYQWKSDMNPIEAVFAHQLFQRFDSLGSFLLKFLKKRVTNNKYKSLVLFLESRLKEENSAIQDRRKSVLSVLKNQKYELTEEDPFINWVRTKPNDYTFWLKSNGLNMTTDPTLIYQALKKDFPDWLDRPETNRIRYEILTLETILEFMAKMPIHNKEDKSILRFLID